MALIVMLFLMLLAKAVSLTCSSGSEILPSLLSADCNDSSMRVAAALKKQPPSGEMLTTFVTNAGSVVELLTKDLDGAWCDVEGELGADWCDAGELGAAWCDAGELGAAWCDAGELGAAWCDAGELGGSLV